MVGGSLVSWTWFGLALVLFAIEALRPGSFALWLGFAAILVGVVASVARWPWPAECWPLLCSPRPSFRLGAATSGAGRNGNGLKAKRKRPGRNQRLVNHIRFNSVNPRFAVRRPARAVAWRAAARSAPVVVRFGSSRGDADIRRRLRGEEVAGAAPLPITQLHRLACACIFAALAVLALTPMSTRAPTSIADSDRDLLQPSLNGNPTNPPTFVRPRSSATLLIGPGSANRRDLPHARSARGAAPVYGSPTGFGAGNTGFNSTIRRMQAADPGSRSRQQHLRRRPMPTFDPVAAPPPQVSSQPPVLAPPLPPRFTRQAQRRGRVRPAAATVQFPISNPPAEVHPLSAANRPGAVLAVPPAIVYTASTPPPARRSRICYRSARCRNTRCRSPRGDPYEALGIKTGSFLILPAVELSTGYDTNLAAHTRRQQLHLLRCRSGTSCSLRLVAPFADRRRRQFVYRLRQ